MEKEVLQENSKEKKFWKIINNIKKIKIQGANNIAKAGIEAFLLFPDKKHAKEILSTRPTEPLLQNFIKILLKSKNPEKTAKMLFQYAENSQNSINREGLTLIKDEMKIYTHCHSSSVIELLKYAKKKGKKFSVYTAEVAPLYQGRMTAKDLAKEGIVVYVTPDLSAENFLKKCDLFLFGADAYTRKYIYNKIGTNTLVKIASLYNVPSYSVGFTLKYTRNVKLEKRSGKEVWNEKNPLINVEYYSFDKIKGRSVTGIICESGILPYRIFRKVAKRNLRELKSFL
ncbi:MAG: hypothetical protein QXG18_02070 [Candidatus Pacearchaeota archaeon]